MLNYSGCLMHSCISLERHLLLKGITTNSSITYSISNRSVCRSRYCQTCEPTSWVRPGEYEGSTCYSGLLSGAASRSLATPALANPTSGSTQRFARRFRFFFFQAEDGIRDLTVTGVQTCALPI